MSAALTVCTIAAQTISPVVLGTGLAALCGSAVAFTELICRYRDEPLKVARYPAAIAYMLLNGTFAAIAYGFSGSGPLSSCGAELGVAVGVGLLAMAGTRAKLFSVRTGDGTEVSVGPALIAERLLAMLDRYIDRKRSEDRLTLIVRLYKPLEGLTAAQALRLLDTIAGHIPSFQNLAPDEKSNLEKSLRTARELFQASPDTATISPLMMVGYDLLQITGARVFESIITEATRLVGSDPAD